MKKTKSIFKNKIFIISVCSVAIIALIFAIILHFIFNGKIKAVETISLKKITSVQDISLTGHRGLSSQSPENTLPAFELAAKNGLTAVEFDIQLTKDNVWILSHDTTLNRMTDSRGKIADSTYFDLAGCNIDNGANIEKYQNLKMPSLDDALDCCLENGLSPMIEIKTFNSTGIKKLVDSIKSHGLESSCQVISFNHDAIDAVRDADSEIKTVYLVTKLDDEHLQQCLDHPDIGVSFKADKKNNSAAVIKKLLNNDTELFCWVVDDKDTLQYYYKAGVRNFVTNRIIP